MNESESENEIPRAMARWFFETFSQDPQGLDQAAGYIYDSISAGKAEEFWKLLEATGDKVYSTETFRKVAKLLIETGRP